VQEHVGHYEERKTRKQIHQKSEDGRRLVVEAADVRVHELTGFEDRVPDGAYVVPRTARVEEGGVEVEEREVGGRSSHLEFEHVPSPHEVKVLGGEEDVLHVLAKPLKLLQHVRDFRYRGVERRKDEVSSRGVK